DGAAKLLTERLAAGLRREIVESEDRETPPLLDARQLITRVDRPRGRRGGARGVDAQGRARVPVSPRGRVLARPQLSGRGRALPRGPRPGGTLRSGAHTAVRGGPGDGGRAP